MKLLSFLKLKCTKRRIILVIILLILILAGFLFFNSRKSIPTLQFATVQKGNIKSTVSASGILAAKNTAVLKFQSGGKLASLNVQAGDIVQAGQLIASLDTSQLYQSLQQAQNSLASAQANVDKVIDDIHLFQYGNGGFSNVGTANETQTQRQARINVQTARDSAQAAVQSAQAVLANAYLFAPIPGVVIKADPVTGQNVAVADIITQISDNSQIFFDADVDEADINKISVGQNAEITLDAYGDKIFHGVVDQILLQTKTASNGGNVVTVKIALAASGIRFVSGLNGQAAIITAVSNNVLTVPQEALKDNNTVVVETNQGLREEKVEPGLRSDTDIEIKSGLKIGERVLKNPPALDQLLTRNLNPLTRIFRGIIHGGRGR